MMKGVETAAAVTNGRFMLPANTVSLLSRSMRTAISAPTRLQAFRTDAAGEQAARRYTHFCFRCARDDITVRIADDYVANAQ